MRIDPHTHSSVSDGTDTPTELMRKAAKSGLDMIGLTDHDTIAGWEEATNAAYDVGVALIRGAEVSAAVDGITVHMLAYLFNPEDARLNEIFEQQRFTRENRARQIVENLSSDYDLSWDDVLAFAPTSGPIGRPHIADALIARGYFPNRNAVFEYTLHPLGPYYVFQQSTDARTLVEEIRRAGGVAVLAHPRAVKRQRLISDDAIAEMVDNGLFGIERDHRDHNRDGQREVDELARKFDLRIFGSSDYHGRGKPNQLGENLTAVEVIAEMENNGQLEVIRP